MDTMVSNVDDLSNLRDKDRALVVLGPDNKEDNRVVTIACQIADYYGHRRESVKIRTTWTAVAADKERDQPKWDFVIERSDGTRLASPVMGLS